MKVADTDLTHHKKPQEPVEKSDPRFLEYADALRAGDVARCEALRHACRRQPEVSTKFDTLERIWLSEMNIYIREIQITQRERDGWSKLAEARRKLIENEKGAPTPKILMRQGSAMLEQAEDARLDQPEVIVPRLFDGLSDV